ncbi:hypothetical protein PInf_017964 [Phytophthora infestans]|nr:hypothetical protein PInf_017964 [Phytophthora infestans]
MGCTYLNGPAALEIPHQSVPSQQRAVSNLAASKLLVGLPIRKEKSYNKNTMFGVAALFCRLGLRPHSACALSTQIVANLMGVLYYVAFMNNTHITSYPTEPVLAFGAARLWYEIEDQTGQQKTTALDIFAHLENFSTS